MHQPKYKRTHLQTIEQGNPSLEHRKHETTKDVQMENYENIKKLQSKEAQCFKISSDLRSLNKGLHPKHKKTQIYSH
jgi:hypothetical protein